MVVGEDGQNVLDPLRTSRGTFIRWVFLYVPQNASICSPVGPSIPYSRSDHAKARIVLHAERLSNMYWKPDDVAHYICLKNAYGWQKGLSL